MIHIEGDLWQDFLDLVRLTYKIHGTEVMWWGRIHTENDKVMVIDWSLPKQEVRTAFVSTTPQQLIEFQAEVLGLHSGMTDEDIKESNIAIQEWGLWCHSHANMGSSYSSEDIDTLEMLAAASGRPYFGLVMNIKGENSLYVAIPFQGVAECHKIGEIEVINTDEENVEIINLIKEKTTKYVPPTIHPKHDFMNPWKKERKELNGGKPDDGELVMIGNRMWIKKVVGDRDVLEPAPFDPDFWSGYEG